MRDFFLCGFPLALAWHSQALSQALSLSHSLMGLMGLMGQMGQMGLFKKADINKRYARTLYNKQCSVAFSISASLGAQSVLR